MYGFVSPLIRMLRLEVDIPVAFAQKRTVTYFSFYISIINYQA